MHGLGEIKAINAWAANKRASDILREAAERGKKRKAAAKKAKTGY